MTLQLILNWSQLVYKMTEHSTFQSLNKDTKLAFHHLLYRLNPVVFSYFTIFSLPYCSIGLYALTFLTVPSHAHTQEHVQVLTLFVCIVALLLSASLWLLIITVLLMSSWALILCHCNVHYLLCECEYGPFRTFRSSMPVFLSIQ